MVYCPECKDKVKSEFLDRASQFEDHYSLEVYDCMCENCGCEFTYTVTGEIEVTKHGEIMTNKEPKILVCPDEGEECKNCTKEYCPHDE